VSSGTWNAIKRRRGTKMKWNKAKTRQQKVPTKSEILQAIKSLRNEKPPEVERTPPEILKVDPHITAHVLYPVIKGIWTEEKMPEDWGKDILIKISKKKELKRM
jgi:hypothetical protein